MAVNSLAYAIALTLGMSLLVAWLRLRFGRANAQRVAVATLVLVTVGYSWLLRDAFNPTRYRSFTSEPRPADVVQLETFLDSGADFYRTLVFPRDIEPIRAGALLPNPCEDWRRVTCCLTCRKRVGRPGRVTGIDFRFAPSDSRSHS